MFADPRHVQMLKNSKKMDWITETAFKENYYGLVNTVSFTKPYTDLIHKHMLEIILSKDDKTWQDHTIGERLALFQTHRESFFQSYDPNCLLEKPGQTNLTFSSHKNDKSKAHYNPKDQGIYLNTFCDDGVALIPLSELHNLKLDHEGKTTYQDKKLSVPALTSLSDLNNTLRHELLHETLGKQVKNYSGHSQEFKDNFKDRKSVV